MKLEVLLLLRNTLSHNNLAQRARLYLFEKEIACILILAYKYLVNYP